MFQKTSNNEALIVAAEINSLNSLNSSIDLSILN